MHKAKITILMIVIGIFSLYSSAELYANVFAHNVRITQPSTSYPFDGNFADGTGAGIRFTLSDNADTVIVNIYDESMTMIRSITETGFDMGENVVVWDGYNDSGSMVDEAEYKVSIYTSSAGYDAYTVLYDEEISIYTRGVTSVRTQDVANFGFTYTASGGGYAFGVGRHTNDMEQFGDVPGDATLSVSYTDDFSLVGSDNLRYSSEADEDGYVYLARRSSTVPGIYRYHVDSLMVSLVDSGGYTDGAGPQGIAIAGTGSEQVLIVSDWNGRIYTFLNDGTTQAHAKTTIIEDDTTLFWDMTVGEKEGWLYATYMSPDTAFLPGVAAFDMSNYSGTPLTLADAEWTVEAPDTATANTITYSPVDGQLYLTFARRPHAPGVQGIYTIKDLEGTPTLELVYADPEDNMTQYRADVAVDAAGNIIFFENSNEFITLISPPTGENAYMYMDNFTTIKAFPTESIAAVTVDADGNNVPDRLDEVVTVQGIVTSPSFTGGSKLPVTIQDETGGIYLYGYMAADAGFNLGDIVKATGTVDHYNGLTELSVDSVEVIGTTLEVEPMEITLADWLTTPEMYESMLITVKGLALVEGTWPDSGSNSNITLTDGYLDFTMRIDKDLDMDGAMEPTYPINLTGVTSQYSSSEPYNTGYQIFPRSYADIDTAVAAAPSAYFFMVSPADGARIEITDSADEFTATWTSSVDLNGDDILYQFHTIGDAFQSGALSDTMFTFTATDLFSAVGDDFDSITVAWTVRCKGAEPDFVESVDTFMVTFINGYVVGVEDATVPHKFFVDQNYPNPFNPTTTIKFGIPEQTNVDLRIYDILGREVATIVNNKSMKAGSYNFKFNATNLASGTYIYRLSTNNNVVTKKMLLLK